MNAQFQPLGLLAALALISLGFAGPAFAADAPPPPPVTTTPPATSAIDPNDKDNEIICHTEDETGTRLRKQKICMTRKQWRTGADDAQTAVSDAQKRGATSNPMKGN